MNTTIGKRGLLAATIAGLFSVGAHAQQACQNGVEQVRTQLEQSSIGEQARQEINDLLSRATTSDTQTCSALVSTARQRLNEADGSSSLQAQQGVQPGQQQAQPGQARPGITTQPGQSQSSQSAQETESSVGQQANQRAQSSQSSQQQTQARQGSQSAQSSQGAQRDTTDVQIDQPAANVEVDAGAPDVRVQQQPPQVTVQQQPPNVTITQPEPEVTVRQADPQVTVRQGEPQVQVQQGEPQVQVRQGGEPEVQVRESGEPQVNVAGERSEQSAQQQAQQAQQTQEQVRPASNLDATEATELVGNNVKTSEGEDVGEISAVARSRTDSELYAIADVGGFLGLGERRVAVPLERADVDRDGNLVTQMSREELEQQREFDEQQFALLR